MGDVIYDKTSRMCCMKQDYGYVIYSHPTVEQKVVRKRVRVYQPYTRERVTILKLPNRPLSGQPKVDIEMKLNRMRQERDSSVRFVAYVAMFWVIFALIGALYVLRQMIVLEQYPDALVENEDASVARRLALLVIGANIPFAFVVNWIRFLMYRNWMVNRGAILGQENGDPRKIQGCLGEASSTDGSDQIPYSILGEDHSYAGTIPSHSAGFLKDEGYGAGVGGHTSTSDGVGQWRAQSTNQTSRSTDVEITSNTRAEPPQFNYLRV